MEDKQQIPQKPKKPTAVDDYRGARDSGIRVTLVDQTGKETKVKV